MLTVYQWGQDGTHSGFKKDLLNKVWKYFLTKGLSVKNQEEFKSSLKSDNACYHSAQDKVSSSILSK